MEYSGFCKHCGQSQAVTVNDEEVEKLDRTVVEIADAKATLACRCDDARKYKNNEQIKNFKGIVGSDAINFMEKFKLEEMTIKDAEGRKAKLKRKASNEINVEITVKELF